MSVLALGSANADLVVRLPHLPAPGATVACPAHEALPGGKGANQAVAAAQDGTPVACAGAAGRDALAAAPLAAETDAFLGAR